MRLAKGNRRGRPMAWDCSLLMIASRRRTALGGGVSR